MVIQRTSRLARFGTGLLPLILAAFAAAVVVAGRGGAPVALAHRLVEFYVGVFSLVALSITVMVGLAATDRLVLMVRHRVLFQAIHRATAVIAVTCLVVHVAIKVVEGHAGLVDAAVPFTAGHRVVYVGLGTVAGYLMVVAMWTGIVRRRFADSAHPGRWRVLHASAYASWLCAMVHGLESGRSARPWVVLSYIGCVILVGLGLAVRHVATRTPRTHMASARSVPSRSAARVSDRTRHIRSFDDGPGASPVGVAPTPALPAGIRETRGFSRIFDGGIASEGRAHHALPPPAGNRDPAPAEISDEEFWAFMRGASELRR